MGFSLLLPIIWQADSAAGTWRGEKACQGAEGCSAPQAQLPVLHMTERRKGRMPDAPGHTPAMGSARNGNPHAGLLYPAVKCNFDKYRWAVKVYLG